MIEYSVNAKLKDFYWENVLDSKFPTKQKVEFYDANLRYGFGTGGNKIKFVEVTPEQAYYYYNTNDSVVSIPKNTISKDDKIFFIDSSFPSLLLGRLDCGVKRTNKIDAADKIVTDGNLTNRDVFKEPYLIDVNKGIISRFYPSWNSPVGDYKKNYNTVVQKAKQHLNLDLKLYISVASTNYEAYELYQKNSSKLVHTKELYKYVVNNLPKLQQSEFDNVVYMLKAADKDTVTMGLSTLQYYNFFDYGIDVLDALANGKCFDLPSTRESEYIYNLLGTNLKTIQCLRNYSVAQKIRFYMDILNKFIVTPDMTVKQKVYTVLRSELFDNISREYKKELDILKVDLSLTPNDENRETDSSTQEMEGV